MITVTENVITKITIKTTKIGKVNKMATKYPDIKVQLTGEDGNAFAIMGAVSKALRNHGVPQLLRDEYIKESMSGDYDNLIRTAMSWVTVL